MHIGISVFLLVLHVFFSSESVNVFHHKVINSNIINKHVHRTIDVSSQLVKINVTIRMQNTGETAVHGFLYAIESKYYRYLAYIAAYTKGQLMYRLKLSDTNVEKHKTSSFKYISFREALLPHSSTDVLVEAIYFHRLVPSPRYVKQQNSQYVHFRDNHYFYSPYVTNVQRTKVILWSQNVKKCMELEPFVQSGNIYKFGPYSNINNFKTSAMMFHYENRSPFLTITKLLRIIIVSHWGTIHVKDSFDLDNKGAIYVGQNLKANKYSLKTIIPRSARNIHCQDLRGDITTKTKFFQTFTELTLKLRLPVTGGTRYRYNVSYLLPTQDFIYYDGDDYVLKMKYTDHIFPNMYIEEAEVKIILPEGASEVMLFIPFTTYRLPNSVENLFLDFVGRPVTSVLATNLVDKHVSDLELLYSFQWTSLFMKPTMFILLFLFMFLSLIPCRRALLHERQATFVEREKDD